MRILSKLLNLPSSLSIRFWTRVNPWLLRSLGARIGRNVVIPGKISLTGGGRLTIGDDFYFSSGNDVNPICSNMQGALHVEPGGTLTIGSHVGMSSTRIWVHGSVTIGNHVNIGGGVFITDTDAHPVAWRSRRTGDEPPRSAPVVIEDDVWVGAQAIILKGVAIGARSVIGAGSVVTRSIPPDSLAAGNPCRVVRRLER